MKHPSPFSLFETHLNVADLHQSVAFYSEVLRLELAYIDMPKGIAFFWIGERGRSMLGLWAGSSSPNMMQLHIAFRVELRDLLQWPQRLESAGVRVLDFFGVPASEPSVIGWMPAASIYFRDPDYHLLEVISMLLDEPDAAAGIVTYSTWLSRKIDRTHLS
jgi:lactoylglutathione lyase